MNETVCGPTQARPETFFENNQKQFNEAVEYLHGAIQDAQNIQQTLRVRLSLIANNYPPESKNDIPDGPESIPSITLQDTLNSRMPRLSVLAARVRELNDSLKEDVENLSTFI